MVVFFKGNNVVAGWLSSAFLMAMGSRASQDDIRADLVQSFARKAFASTFLC